jgi:acyl carrier protein
MNREEILTMACSAIGEALHLQRVEEKRETTFLEIEGWDSLSYTLAILSLEKAFQIRLPMERLYGLENLGQLADLIQEVLSQG